jgi:hypothetical protein
VIGVLLFLDYLIDRSRKLWKLFYRDHMEFRFF